VTKIRLQSVTKRFSRKPEAFSFREASPSSYIIALDDLSLTIPGGETMSIVGPSACGKTTLLRIIAGLEKPDEGKVYFDGQDVTGLPPYERQIGMVFQNYALYPHLTGRENLAFPFRVQHREEEIDERVRVTSEVMGIGFEALLERLPRTMSEGQRQRLAIGRCIVRDPSVFLFDEPLSNLDARLRAATRVQLKRLLRRFHITSVYVTHDQQEATALGDRLAVMLRGRIEQVGTFRQVYDRPLTPFVGGFIGQPGMNLVEGRIVGREFVGEGFRVAVSRLQAEVCGRLPLVLGIRPEGIGLDSGSPIRMRIVSLAACRRDVV